MWKAFREKIKYFLGLEVEKDFLESTQNNTNYKRKITDKLNLKLKVSAHEKIPLT